MVTPTRRSILETALQHRKPARIPCFPLVDVVLASAVAGQSMAALQLDPAVHARGLERSLEEYPLDRIYINLCFSRQHAPYAVFRDGIDSILKRHWKSELHALMENVAMDGSAMLDLPEGRMVNPGHAIECAWMLLEIAARRNDDALRQTAYDIILASLERGWDEAYGGIRYILNIDGSPTHPLEADMKLWWPHCEALYALLLAWKTSGRADFGRWYEKVHDYAFNYFPDRECGEWYGYLNREGSPTWTAKATAWKCFFHLPRVLLRCYQLLGSGNEADGFDTQHSACGSKLPRQSEP
jgi:hypothetical protein